MDQSLEVGRPHLIVHDGEPVGIMAVAPGQEEARLREHLEGAGYRLAEPTQDADGTMSIDDECEVQAPEVCMTVITLGRIDELAEEAGASSTEITDLEQRRFTVAEARDAAKAVIGRMPDGPQRIEAETFYRVRFEADRLPEDEPNGRH